MKIIEKLKVYVLIVKEHIKLINNNLIVLKQKRTINYFNYLLFNT